MPVRVEEEYQELVEQLSTALNLEPAFVRKFFTSNVVQRVLSYLLAWDIYSGQPVKLVATPDGRLKVESVAVLFANNDTKTGTAPDDWGTPLVFDQVASRVDIWVFNNPMLFRRSVDGSVWQDPIELQANSFYSFDGVTYSIQVKNKTAGQSATYQIVGWW